MKSALLIIDMINDFNFTHGDMLYTHTESIIEPILHLKNTMKKQELPIIYINDHYNLWQADFLHFTPPLHFYMIIFIISIQLSTAVIY